MARSRKPTAFDFKPFSRKQLQLLNWWREGSPYADRFIVIADGAIRSGKTTAMIASFLLFTQERFKGCDFIIAGRSVGALKRNVINPMIKMIAAWGWMYEYNRSDNVITIGANQYYMFGANSERSQDIVQGMTAAGALLDEAAIMPQSFVEQALGRCSVEGAKVFMNCNPAGPFHYIKTDFIDKAESSNVYRLKFSMTDNLTLSPKTLERYKSMFKGVFYLRFIQGLWVQAEGLIYDMFTDETNVFAPSQAPENIGSEYQRYIAVDYGTTNPCVFLDIRYNGAEIWIVNEYYFDSKEARYQKTDRQYADDMERFIDGEEPRFIVIDPSASSFRVTLRLRRHPVREANNDVLYGIRATASLIAQGKLHVSKLCVKTLEEFRVYSWDEKAAQRGDEQPVKSHDHAMDAIRYFCNTIVKDRDIA